MIILSNARLPDIETRTGTRVFLLEQTCASEESHPSLEYGVVIGVN